MVRSILGLLAAVLLLAPAAPVAADTSPTLARIVKNKTLKVGVSGNQPPLNFMANNGKLMGMEIDLARMLGATMDAKVEFVQKPFGDLLEALQAGDVDMVMSGMTITPQRNMRVAFVGPYHLTGKSVLTKSATLAAAKEAADIDDAQLSLSALRGSTSETFVDAVFPNAELKATDNYEDAVNAVLEDKVQAMVADFEASLLAVLLHPRANLVMSQRPLTVEPIGIAVAPGDALLVNFLENTLGAIEVSGMLKGLRTRWLEKSDWVELLPE